MNKVDKTKVIQLVKECPSLIDVAIEMIELGIKGGYYTDDVADNYEFVIEYLVDEINSGFISIK